MRPTLYNTLPCHNKSDYPVMIRSHVTGMPWILILARPWVYIMTVVTSGSEWLVISPLEKTSYAVLRGKHT